jgi:DNA mismatch endonuclease, patch repair protein
MRANRHKDTGPELLVRRLLREAGVTGYRLHWPVAGRPDLAFPSRKIAIFVHGCYWHGHGCGVRRGTHNAGFWEEKIRANRRRDREAMSRLRREDWIVVIIWECALRTLNKAALRHCLEVIKRRSTRT